MSQIGRYDVLDEIGRGGMGVVFQAYDPALDRSVALKLLSPHLAHSPDFVTRLRREAISAARLRHPHIALLYEFGQDDGAAFLAMEYVDGPSLRQLLAEGPLSPAQALPLVTQIASALDYAHALGIVHRDVKPSNILVNAAGEAVLIDFGLAQMAEDPLVTSDGALLGTPHYMAPEQASGAGADARSDQYALAAVVYEMLTGTPLFHSCAPAAVVHAHIYEPPQAPSERNPTLPPAVDAVLLRALAKQPAARYPSLSAFADDLRAALVGQPAARRARRPRWLLAGALALAILGALALALLVGEPLLRASQAQPAPRPSVDTVGQIVWAYDPGFAGGGEPAALPGVIVFNTLDGALVALEPEGGGVRWMKDGAGAFFGTPSAGAGQVFVGDTNGAVFCLDPTTGAVVWEQRVDGSVQEPPLRSNERLIATTTEGSVYVLETGTGALVWSRALGQPMLRPAMGASSVFLVAGRTLLALDINTGAPLWQFEAESQLTTAPVVAGDAVLVGSERGVLYGVLAASGEGSVYYRAYGPLSAAPLADDSAIYVADQSGRLAAIRRDTRQPIWQIALDTAIVAAPLLVEDRLFVGTGGGAVYTLDARSGRELARVQLDGSLGTAPVLGDGAIYARAKKIYALGP